MTATDERPAATCPAWCDNGTEEYPCNGEHFQMKEYLPATGGQPQEVTFEGGAQFPVIGVGLDWCQLEGDQGPSVALHAGGPRGDWDLYLRPKEAEALARQILDRLEVLYGGPSAEGKSTKVNVD